MNEPIQSLWIELPVEHVSRLKAFVQNPHNNMDPSEEPPEERDFRMAVWEAVSRAQAKASGLR